MVRLNPAKILVVFGTRPEAIKLFPLIAALKSDPRFDTRICVSAQHRGLLDQVLAVTGMVPDHDLDLMRCGQSLDALTAALLTGLGTVMDAECPSRVIVQGDTATALSGALAACYRQIPLDHVEAGLRSGNLCHPWPEEANRKAITAMASLHFAPTVSAAAALRAENVDPARIHVTGNTGIDALHWVNAQIMQDSALASGLDGIAARFAGKRIIAVTCHRRENLGEGLANIAEAVRRIARRDDVAVVFPVHPNPQVRAVIDRVLGGLGNVALTGPLDYPHFARLIGMSHIVLTDSGGVQEEAPALGKPVLVMRETTERPEAIAAGAAKLVGTEPAMIVKTVCSLLDDRAAYESMAKVITPFGDGKAAERIVALLADEIRGDA